MSKYIKLLTFPKVKELVNSKITNLMVQDDDSVGDGLCCPGLYAEHWPPAGGGAPGSLAAVLWPAWDPGRGHPPQTHLPPVTYSDNTCSLSTWLGTLSWSWLGHWFAESWPQPPLCQACFLLHKWLSKTPRGKNQAGSCKTPHFPVLCPPFLHAHHPCLDHSLRAPLRCVPTWSSKLVTSPLPHNLFWAGGRGGDACCL